MSTMESIEAYTLISVEHGADEEVLDGLMKIDEVKEASLVYGEYDVHCKIEVVDMDKLREVIGKIRTLKVRTTETLIAYERASERVKRLSNRRRKQLRDARTRR